MTEGEVPSQIPPEEKSPESDSEKAYVERSAAFEKIDSYSDNELRQKGSELGIEGPTSKIREALKTEWDEAYEEKAQAASSHIESQRAQVAGPGLPEGAAKAYEEAVAVAKHRAEAVRLVEAAKAPLRERAAEAGKKKAGELAQIGKEKAQEAVRIAREKAPVVRAKSAEAAENFSSTIEDIIVRAEPKMAALIERGKKVLGKVKETDPREALASLIDLPANFAERAADWLSERAQKLQKERDEKIAAFEAEKQSLKEASKDRRKDHWTKMMDQAKAVEAEFNRRDALIAEKYGESYKHSPKVAQKREKDIDALIEWRDAQKDKLRDEREAFLASEKAVLEQATERLTGKYSRRIERAAGRASEAVDFRETWVSRARRARRTANSVREFLGIGLSRKEIARRIGAKV